MHARLVGRVDWQGFTRDHLDGLIGAPDLQDLAIGFDLAKGKADFWKGPVPQAEALGSLHTSPQKLDQVPFSKTKDGLYDLGCEASGKQFRAILDTGSNLNEAPTGLTIPWGLDSPIKHKGIYQFRS